MKIPLDFIKLTVVYQANPARRAANENDMRMREMYIRAMDVLEITPIVADDEAVIAKTFIRTASAPGPMSVMETAEEILEAICQAERV